MRLFYENFAISLQFPAGLFFFYRSGPWEGRHFAIGREKCPEKPVSCVFSADNRKLPTVRDVT
jgi:hypothetical protein